MVQGLTEAEELEYLQLLEAEYGGESLTQFINRVAPREPPPEHIAENLIPVLEQAAHGPIRCVVDMPPRHAKSITVQRALIWFMQRNPTLLNAYATFAQDIAENQSRQMLGIASDAGLRLAEGSRSVGLWRTPERGGLKATSIMGSITSLGIKGWLVIDDPHKDRVEAESKLIRDRVWEQFRGTFYNRLEEDASIFVIQTRWHEDDLAGRILRGELGDEKWIHVDMPAIRDPRTGHAADDDETDGLALWPGRFPLERLRTLRQGSGVYNWWSLYQQRPRARGHALFSEKVGRFDRRTVDLTGFRLIWAVDPAATAKTSSDYSVAVLMAVKGYGEQAIAYILDVVRVQEQIPPFVRRVAALARARRCGVVVEAVAGFLAVPQMLREIAPGMRVVEAKVKGDKFVRAQSLAAAWNTGRVLVPTDAPWSEVYLEEFLAFTGLGDIHDDQVDATAHAWDALYAPMPARRGARDADFLPFG